MPEAREKFVGEGVEKLRSEDWKFFTRFDLTQQPFVRVAHGQVTDILRPGRQPEPLRNKKACLGLGSPTLRTHVSHIFSDLAPHLRQTSQVCPGWAGFVPVACKTFNARGTYDLRPQRGTKVALSLMSSATVERTACGGDLSHPPPLQFIEHMCPAFRTAGPRAFS